MFCRNCGNEMDNNAAVCVRCGVAVGGGSSYCQNCGQPTMPGAAACTSCGVFLSQPVPAGQQKSRLAAGLLGIFLGSLGIHNFYLGKTKLGLIQILLSVCTCGIASPAVGIWGLVEGIMILTGNIAEDGRGVPLKD